MKIEINPLRVVGALVGVAIIFFCLGVVFKTSQHPEKVYIDKLTENQSQLVQLSQKVSEYEEQISKFKSESKQKSKILITHADGSSELRENESSETIENELIAAKSKSVEDKQMIESLQSKVHEISETVNSSVSFDPRLVYDSDRGMEFEVSAGKSIYSASAGFNKNTMAWRTGLGLHFKF